MIPSDGYSGEVSSDTEETVCRFDVDDDLDDYDDGGGGGQDEGSGDGDGDDGGGEGSGGGGAGGGDSSGGRGTNDDDDHNIKEEIVSCILRGLILAEEMKSSIKSMENLLEYEKDLFCKGDHNLEKYWPSNWRETKKLLKEVGYGDPK